MNTPDSSVASPADAVNSRPGHAAALSIIIGIMLAMFLSALEQTIVAPALPTMGRVLGDAENLSWVVTAYLLAATAMTPLFGKLSDIHGRRIMMLIAVAIFIAGSVVCALAPNMAVRAARCKALAAAASCRSFTPSSAIWSRRANARATRPTPR